MFRAGLDRCRQSGGVGVAGVDEGWLALGEGPGLGKDDRIEGSCSLEGETILHE